MSIGRTFKQALQKGIRSMEVKRFGLGLDRIDKWWKWQSEELANHSPVQALGDRGSLVTRTAALEEQAQVWPIPPEKLARKLAVPSQGRMYYIRYAFKMGQSVEQVHELTRIDPWFLAQMKELVDFEDELLARRGEVQLFAGAPAGGNSPEKKTALTALLLHAKELGYSDVQLGTVWGLAAAQVRALRKALAVQPVYKLVDTCAAEFEAATPYYYSSYEQPVRRIGAVGLPPAAEDEVRVTAKKKVIILGGGPNRIGQGIEFDYCRVGTTSCWTPSSASV